MATKILLLSANPLDTARLRLDKEFKSIDQSLENNDGFEVKLSLAVTATDIRKDLSKHKPNILHFSGHGEGQQGLLIENEQGESQLLRTEAIGRLLALYKENIQCVLLNACYSQYQAEAIVQHIDYVIGMNDAIGDTAAIEFSVAFYDSLAAGEAIPRAFEIACTNLDIQNLQDTDKPVLLQKPELQTAYHNNAQFDAFISYAPEDDEHSWVKTLTTNLQAGLEKELKATSAFCYIPRSQRNLMTKSRVDSLQNSFLLIAIVTPDWLDNKFCQAEFDSFLKQNPANRIIFLEKTRIDKLPELSAFNTVSLWLMEKEQVDTLIYPDQENPDRIMQYFQKINDAARYLAEQLKFANSSRSDIPATPEQPESPDICPAEPASHCTVFLTDNADDVMTQRDDLVRYLQQQNIKLVSQDSYYHSDSAELAKQIDADLNQAQLFVQLLSPLTVRRPPGMATPTLQLQRAVALKKPILQWHHKDCDPATIQDLMPESAFADSLESFKNYLLQRIKIISTPKPEKKQLAGRLLFINAERIDKQLAEQIGAVAQEEGLYLSYPLQEGTPDELRADLTDNLLECDGVLMLYGNSPVRWVRSQLRQAIKISRQRKPQLPLWVLCEMPPTPKDNLNMPLPAFISLFHATDKSAESLVQHLLSEWEAKQ